MKTIGTIFFLILLSLLALAQTESWRLDPTTGLAVAVKIARTNALDKMTAEADLIFKGRVISSRAETNTSFPSWGKPHATTFALISVLKGNFKSNVLVFWHNTSGPQGWGGGTPPSFHQLETNNCYLVFARQLDKSDYLFSIPSDATNRPNEFRQLYIGGVFRTLDGRPLAGLSVSNALWSELNLLLNDKNPTNQLYAINEFDSKSLAGRGDDWLRGDYFARKDVLLALLPLTTNSDNFVAVRAIHCFATSSNIADQLSPFTNALIRIANKSSSSDCRLTAISALSGIDGDAVSNSLSLLLKDADENIRAGAVGLLPSFPEEFAVQALRERADDESANVRAIVADVIGNEKYERALPTLAKLFADPVGKDPLIKPMTMEYLKAGQRWSNGGDVHTSAGLALVKFAPNQVSDILKSNLDDPGFHINFVAKLAQGDPEPWLPELVSILETRRAFVEDVLKSPWNDPRRFSDPQADRILIGTYAKCWEDIRQYLLQQSPEALASGRFDSYMDLLEKTVRPVQGMTVQEANLLYALYSTKHLSKRATGLRQLYARSNGWWFDDYDQRGEAAFGGFPPFSF